jgi:hypothetical protein
MPATLHDLYVSTNNSQPWTGARFVLRQVFGRLQSDLETDMQTTDWSIPLIWLFTELVESTSSPLLMSQKTSIRTPDLNCPAIERLLKSRSQIMKISAPLSVHTTTLDTIEVMVRSEYLFFHKNLHILVSFTFSVAPTIDGTADSCQSDRLTTLLDDVNIHRGVQTV